MEHRSSLSIRNILTGLGALSVLISFGLAGMGLMGMQRQLDARARVVFLERALNNHNIADAFMDNVRNDALRALASKLGTSRESSEFIRSELRHHIDVLTSAILDDSALPLGAELHGSYVRLAEMLPGFVEAGRATVELALTDPNAGSARYESFRHGFSSLEALMDAVREELQTEVEQVRARASQTATVAKQMITMSALLGIVVLMVITWIAVRIVGRITADLARAREEARHLALHDVLTGLPNRSLLNGRLDRDLAHAPRLNTKIAVLCLDLDRFKHVNDTLGHQAGDALLCEVAVRLRACVRDSDTVARLGGDEFAVIQAPVARIAEVVSLARRIIEVLSQPYDLGGHEVVVGASIGISLAPDDALHPGELFLKADLALYSAKNDRRGTYRLFESEMDRQLQSRKVGELDVAMATVMGEFKIQQDTVIEHLRAG